METTERLICTESAASPNKMAMARIFRALHLGAGFVLAPVRRLLAASGLPLSGRDRRIEQLRDKHAGKRAFVIGAGPSLVPSDLDQLHAEITFASNKIYLAFEETDWRPTYYSVVDVLVARNNAERIHEQTLQHIHSEHVLPELGMANSFLYLDHLPYISLTGQPGPGFSKELLRGVCGGYTVIYLQLQLAFFMGIREVYLLGVDFDFDVPPKGMTTAKTSLGETVILSQGEVNHFHPEYREQGETWTMPKLDEQRLAFARARQAFEAAGGKLVNVSRRTKLDVLPREDFDLLLPRTKTD